MLPAFALENQSPSAAAVGDWFPAADVVEGGEGTLASPWPIATALRSDQIRPGQTLCLRGGTYRAETGRPFRVALVGTAEKPIIVRSYPGDADCEATPPVCSTWNGSILNTCRSPRSEA
jgi:hypothetical protein